MTRLIPFILCAWCAYAQPVPIAVEVEDGPLTNHVCEARLPVAFVTWKAPTNWVPKTYRVYASTNPFAPLTAYTFRAEVPDTLLVVKMKQQEFFCVTATDGKGFETARINK